MRDMNELSPHNSAQPSCGDWVTGGFVVSECEEISATSARYYDEAEGQTIHSRSPKPIDLGRCEASSHVIVPDSPFNGLIQLVRGAWVFIWRPQ